MKLNVLEMCRKAFEEASSSIKVKMVDTEMELAFDAREDSVTTHPTKLVAKVEGIEKTDTEAIPPMDSSSLREVRVYVEGNMTCNVMIMVSPEDHGDFFVRHQDGPLVARRLRVDVEGVEGTVHLVGRS